MAADSVCEGLSFAKDTEKYIVTVLDPILEEMITDVITAQPKDPLLYMIAWLRKRCGASAGAARLSVAAVNQKLKDELHRQAGMLGEMGASIRAQSSKLEDDEEEDEDEDDDCGDELPAEMLQSAQSKSKARTSVSAEAYGAWNAKKAFDPPVYAKSDDQKVRLADTLSKSFMFAELEPQDLETIILAMKECLFTPGTKVIEEGESGDYLFVIERGILECFKQIGKVESKLVKTCADGDVFGELALLYNCPRAANVVAKNQCICWQLDRDTFNNIVKDAAVKRREKYDKFLHSVTLLSSIDAYERSQIADALVPETFTAGQVIVKQDDPGDKFYIVESGNLYASKNDARVGVYKPGDYFGELALLKNQPRAASVIVSSDTARVLSMSRVSFNKMLGPLAHVLSSRVNTYV
jgi:cAMP-dependent protein kinase regulator